MENKTRKRKGKINKKETKKKKRNKNKKRKNKQNGELTHENKQVHTSQFTHHHRHANITPSSTHHATPSQSPSSHHHQHTTIIIIIIIINHHHTMVAPSTRHHHHRSFGADASRFTAFNPFLDFALERTLRRLKRTLQYSRHFNSISMLVCCVFAATWGSFRGLLWEVSGAWKRAEMVAVWVVFGAVLVVISGEISSSSPWYVMF